VDTDARGLACGSSVDAKEAHVRKPALVTVGVVVAVLGVVFTLQGLGLLGGSPMTGSTLWAILGPVVALLGIVLAVYGLRSGRRR
jgi:hypothetical protein